MTTKAQEGDSKSVGGRLQKRRRATAKSKSQESEERGWGGVGLSGVEYGSDGGQAQGIGGKVIPTAEAYKQRELNVYR